MRKAIPWLMSGWILAAGAGCEHNRWGVRKDDPSSQQEESDSTSKVIGGDGDTSGKSILKGTRRSGGWSSEARDIERDLGVGS